MVTEHISSLLASLPIQHSTTLMIQYNPRLLNERIAPEIAEFDTAEIPNLQQEFNQSTYWLSNSFLNSLFTSTPEGNWKQWEINLLFRAQAQFESYLVARDLTYKFFEKSSLHNPATSIYFKALAQWESAFLNYQIFLDIYKKATKQQKVFTADDGSEEQRSYYIANTIKHWGSDIQNNRHKKNHTIPVWLNKNGFQTHSTQVSYCEFAAITKEIAKTGDLLQNPGS